ncbi:Matrilin-4 [Bulinus truncatus]|nr:Matrilin-4 [Bulinus truncatus]
MAPARLLLTLSLLVIFGFTQFTLGVEHHVCKEAEIELAIVLDASSSIRPKDFKSSLRFLQDYLRQFDVGAERHMRVALVTFAKEAHPENGFNLTTYENEEEMIAAIGRIRYLKERYTNTGHALQYMRQVILPRDSTRPTANRVALVITDGNSQKPKRTAAEAKAARDDGIALFVIGIGKKIRERELLDIGGDPTRVARLETFHQLHAFIKTLAVMTCISE